MRAVHFTSATCALAAVAFAVAPRTAARADSSDDVRTFEVTVQGDDDVPESGTATATLEKTQNGKMVYALTRKVPGLSSAYDRGTATVDVTSHRISVVFDEDKGAAPGAPATATPQPPRTGIVQALGAAGATAGAEAGEEAAESAAEEKIEGGSPIEEAIAGAATAVANLVPTQPERYVYYGQWSTKSYHFRETWRELTHLTSTISITSPKEDSAQDASKGVLFAADVPNADHVEFSVDGTPIGSFEGSGHHEMKRVLYVAGFRRFVVNAYGKPSKADPAGALLGTADVAFEVSGFHLVPENESKVGPTATATAEPIGLTDLKTVEIRLDDRPVATLHAAPWSAPLTFATPGKHRITAVGWNSKHAEIARTHSDVNVSGVEPGADVPPPPPTSASRPDITQVPASPRNYVRHSSRKITLIVIHKAEGSLDATTSWFRNPASKVSAHYCVSDTETAQMVPDVDVCWHTGNHAYNQDSIGIENSGYTNKNDMTAAHYTRLAQLVAYLCKTHGLPIDRKHVIGHNEVPDPNHPGELGGAGHHEDPGPYFDWNKLMSEAKSFAK